MMEFKEMTGDRSQSMAQPLVTVAWQGRMRALDGILAVGWSEDE
jgi:hypothetical protein